MIIHDNKIHLVYGAKGSGKTTLSAYITKEAVSKNIDVYSNTPIKGAYRISIDDIREKYIPGGIVIIDEAAAEINCRDWRETGIEFLRTMQMARHMDLTIYFLSQSVNAIDIQVTDLCDDAICCFKLPFGYSSYRRAYKQSDRRGRPYFVISKSVFDVKLLLRKKYYSLFDTHYITSELSKRPSIKRKGW